MFMAALFTRVSWASQVALAVKDPPAKCRKHWTCRFDPRARKIPWRRKRQPALVFLLGEFHGQRSLVGYSPWGHRELDTNQHERARAHTHTHTHTHTRYGSNLSAHQWMERKDVAYIYHTQNGLLHSHNKHEISPSATPWMECDYVLLNEVSDRERQTLYDFSHTWNLETKQTKKHKKWTNQVK